LINQLFNWKYLSARPFIHPPRVGDNHEISTEPVASRSHLDGTLKSNMLLMMSKISVVIMI
jgi:hypothetical protein